jgi:hypothetical protein
MCVETIVGEVSFIVAFGSVLGNTLKNPMES